ncbi:MAG: TlpA disulfide reductase family protein [Bacteroidota bacterium]
MKSTLLLIIGLGLLVKSCQNQKEPDAASVVIKLASETPTKLEAFNIERDILLSTDKPLDSFKLSIKEPVILNFDYQKGFQYIYLEPNERLVIKNTIAEEGLEIQSPMSEANKFLSAFADSYASQTDQPLFSNIRKHEVDSFLLLVRQKFEPLDQLLVQVADSKEVDAAFKKALKMRLLAIKGNELFRYKDNYHYHHKKMPVLPDDYYQAYQGIDTVDASILTFGEGRRFIDNWTRKDIINGDEMTPEVYIDAYRKIAQQKYANKLLRDYGFYEVIESTLRSRGDVDRATDLIADYKKDSLNNYFNHKLAEMIAPWLLLKTGAEAPDVVVEDRTGKKVKLSSLKGKRLYIDVWATWCGPCIQEIPALQELQQAMKGKNIEFVSISIDMAERKSKWLNFIEEKALSGLQFYSDGGWESEVAVAYNITGIPRFLLIDEAGKIISAHAPRPSDPKIRDVLLN